jgi:hypothetical protein
METFPGKNLGCTHGVILGVLPSTLILFLISVGENDSIVVRFEVFTAVTMKNGVFWDVMPCGSCKNRHIGGT